MWPRLQTRSGVTGPAGRLCPAHPCCVLPGALMSLLSLMTRTRTDTWNKRAYCCVTSTLSAWEMLGLSYQKTEEGGGGARREQGRGAICLKCPILITLGSFLLTANALFVCLFAVAVGLCCGTRALCWCEWAFSGNGQGASPHRGAQASHCGGLPW